MRGPQDWCSGKASRRMDSGTRPSLAPPSPRTVRTRGHGNSHRMNSPSWRVSFLVCLSVKVVQLRRQKDGEAWVQVSASPRALCDLGEVTAALWRSVSSPERWGQTPDPHGIFQAFRHLCQTPGDLSQAQGSRVVTGAPQAAAWSIINFTWCYWAFPLHALH